MRNLLIIILSVFFLSLSAQEQAKYQLSTHILDISQGKVATNVDVQLEKYNEKTKQWDLMDAKKTDANGRISDFLQLNPLKKDNNGVFKLKFFTSEYFKRNNLESFYPYIEVVFQIKDQEHYHVPITLSPFGYSTYRGS